MDISNIIPIKINDYTYNQKNIKEFLTKNSRFSVISRTIHRKVSGVCSLENFDSIFEQAIDDTLVYSEDCEKIRAVPPSDEEMNAFNAVTCLYVDDHRLFIRFGGKLFIDMDIEHIRLCYFNLNSPPWGEYYDMWIITALE